jgi:hypothetical protein
MGDFASCDVAVRFLVYRPTDAKVEVQSLTFSRKKSSDHRLYIALVHGAGTGTYRIRPCSGSTIRRWFVYANHAVVTPKLGVQIEG